MLKSQFLENIASLTEGDAFTIIAKDNEFKLFEAINTLNSKGVTIYIYCITTPVINIFIYQINN